ncbi:DUF2071 domain-containing protein [Halostella sp. JP-L12]|uniref:YqjF family protein n=1 Tax=Halostella TaxID=1843185 RepID=UPI000EF7DA35|nr:MULTISPECIES: DUF2071 domain-containing protein [Halostella]NHN49145.1 DUF2071 domain-containing protein [Halostella sp. JP-L12]
MEWRDVLFANWPVDPDLVAAHLPPSLSVDTHEGRAWLSVVPFLNDDVRPLGVPAVAGLSLPELNLRTYVTRDGVPGVYFFSLDAEGLLGVLGARVMNHLPYYNARIAIDETDDGTRFTSRRRHPGARPVDFAATYRGTGDRFYAEEGSLAAFLTARFRYFTEAQDGTVRYASIDHDPWPLYEAEVRIDRNTLFRANGFRPPESDPVHLYSPGVTTTASESRRWRPIDDSGAD